MKLDTRNIFPFQQKKKEKKKKRKKELKKVGWYLRYLGYSSLTGIPVGVWKVCCVIGCLEVEGEPFFVGLSAAVVDVAAADTVAARVVSVLLSTVVGAPTVTAEALTVAVEDWGDCEEEGERFFCWDQFWAWWAKRSSGDISANFCCSCT